MYLLEVPVENGGSLVVEVNENDVPSDLQLASKPGEIAARASQTLEQALDQVKPAIGAVLDKIRTFAPDKVTVEFGLVLGAETGVIVAKGTAEVHFTVTLGWTKPVA